MNHIEGLVLEWQGLTNVHMVKLDVFRKRSTKNTFLRIRERSGESHEVGGVSCDGISKRGGLTVRGEVRYQLR